METVSVREARRRLPELVEAAERGETVVVTRRGKRVARIVPLRETLGLPDLTEFRASIAVRGEPLSKAVMEERQTSRF